MSIKGEYKVTRRVFLAGTAAVAINRGLALAGSAGSTAAERKPNVIIILTDDQGAADAHC